MPIMQHGSSQINKLEEYIAESWSDEVKTMNDLQDNGIISDNSIMAKDVCDSEAKKAVEWLEK
jgi:hypothetical protein